MTASLPEQELHAAEGSADEMTSDDWCTARDLAALLGRWDLDPSSNRRSHISAAYRCALDGSGDSDDGLAMLWPAGCSVFCNPPYSDPLPWAWRLRSHRGPWCALVKLDPTTRWWSVLMLARPSVAPFRKRLKFECAPGGAKRSSRSRQTSAKRAETLTANFPSVLVYRDWEPSRALARLLWMPRTRAVAIEKPLGDVLQLDLLPAGAKGHLGRSGSETCGLEQPRRENEAAAGGERSRR